MPVASIIFGILLCGLSVFGMVGSVEKIATAFVPMMFGIPLVITGIISLNPHRGRVWMRIAAAIAFCAFVTAVGCALYRAGEMAQGEELNRFAFGLVGGWAGLSAAFLTTWLIVFFRKRSRRSRRSRGLPPAKRRTSTGGKRPTGAANPS